MTVAAAYVIGLGIYGTALSAFEEGTPVDQVAFLAEHETTFLVVTIVIYLIVGVALVPLVMALHRWLRPAASSVEGAAEMLDVGAIFGLIWGAIVIASGMISNIGMANVVDLFASDPAQAGSAWTGIEAVSNGLGGGSELVGALWVLLITVAAWRSGQLSQGVNVLGLMIGVAGIVTVVPALSVFQYVFGIAQIPWFIWLGVMMIRSTNAGAATAVGTSGRSETAWG